MKTDLHIHSGYSSDGEAATGHILQMCIEKGVDVFTISDHNTVAGAREMEQSLGAANTTAVKFIPGIEIDCVFEGTDMHLLGLGIDTSSGDFDAVEKDIHTLSLDAFEQMVDRIRKIGFPVDRNKIMDFAGDKSPTGEMIAETMLADDNRGCKLLEPYYPGGARSDMPLLNFYFDWFAQGCPAYVPIKFMDFSQAVGLVVSNGGTPVVAHPGQNFRGREDAARRLLKSGAAGIECFNNYHSEDQARYFASLAIEYNSIMTLGSDYHGKVKPLIEIGVTANDALAVEYSAHLDQGVIKLIG